MKDLILGLGNLRAADMAPFLGSLNQTSFNGDVCMFVYDISLENIEYAKALGVKIEDGRRFLTSNRHVMNSRFLMFLDFVSRYAHKYDHVMLTDVRDVIFQSNPFLGMGGEEIRYACEQALIKDCPINGAWVYQAYGYGVLENIRDYLISCAGTTIGTTGGILRYLTAMVDEMSKCAILDRNIDQGIHNYIVRMRPLRHSLIDVSDCLIATLEHMPPERLSVMSRGVAVGGHVLPVIHQWDRRPLVKEYVLLNQAFKVPTVSVCGASSASSDVSSRAQGFIPPYFDRSASWRPTARLLCAERRVIVAFVAAGDLPQLEGFLRSIRAQPHHPGVVLCTLATTLVDAEMAAVFGAEVLTYEFSSEFAVTNVAHLCIQRALQAITAVEVLALENVRCRIQADVWQYIASNISLSAEGGKRLADCNINVEWMSYFGEVNDRNNGNQIISSEIVAGDMQNVADFYAEVVALLSKRSDALGVSKLVQGAFNWIVAERRGEHTVHPNGSFAFLNFWPSEMIIENDVLTRVGGAVPAILLHP